MSKVWVVFSTVRREFKKLYPNHDWLNNHICEVYDDKKTALDRCFELDKKFPRFVYFAKEMEFGRNKETEANNPMDKLYMFTKWGQFDEQDLLEEGIAFEADSSEEAVELAIKNGLDAHQGERGDPESWVLIESSKDTTELLSTVDKVTLHYKDGRIETLVDNEEEQE